MGLLIFIGVLAGMLSTTIGVGGGIILVPYLTLVAKQPLRVAVAASVATMVVSTSVGIVLEHIAQPGNTEWPYALTLATGSFLGVWLAKRIDKRVPERALVVVFACILFVAAADLVGLIGEPSRGGLLSEFMDSRGIDRNGSESWMLRYPVVALLGVGGGITATLFGLGGGIIFVPGLAILFTRFSQDVQHARGTSMGAVMFIAAYVTWVQHRQGLVNWPLVRQMMLGCLIGAAAGVFVAHALPSETLKFAVGVFVAISAARMLMARKPKEAAQSPAPAPSTDTSRCETPEPTETR